MQRITKRLSAWAVFVAALLLVPLLANAPWTGSDFVFAAVALFDSALVFELVTKEMDNYNHKLIVAFIVLSILGFVWVAAATGFEGLERFM
jgi:hypothetical protein